MGSSPPKPLDPVKTAGAQTGMNVGTAVANQMMGYGTQTTPYGTQTTSAGAMQSWTDPVSGKTYQLPGTNVTSTLSPQQKALQDAQTRAGTNTATLAADQSARLGGILGKPMNFSGAPQVSAPNLNFAASNGTPNLDKTIGWAGPINRSFGGAGDIDTSIDWSGPINRRFADAGDIATKFGAAGDITRSYGDQAGYAEQRQRVEDALMSRINPQLDQDRERLRTQLANQGIKQGTAAYDEGFADFGKQSNDARYGAILGAGEEQSRLAGLDQNRAQFENSAQQQAYQQALGRGQFGNDAQQQAYQQALGRGQYSLQAQAQRYGQNANDAQFGNAAQQQAYQQALGRGQFSLDAQAQRFGQNAAQAAFGNNATQQMFGNRMDALGFNNAAQQQQFANQQSMRGNYMNEQYAQRNQPINEISALLGTGGVTQPNFAPQQGGGIAGTDFAGLTAAAKQQKMQQYQQQQQQMGGLFGGLGGIASAGIGAF